MQTSVIQANKSHAKAIAELHYHELYKSFLRNLGIPFLKAMYQYFIIHEIVLVSLNDENQVDGFVSGTKTKEKMMMRFILKNPLVLFIVLYAVIRKPSILKSVFETYRVASDKQEPQNLPSSELLSIAVSSKNTQSGVGTKLLNALNSKFIELGIDVYKVVVGKELNQANKFYIKNGFIKVYETTVHGDEISNVYIKKLSDS